MCSYQYLVFDYFLSWFPMGFDFSGNTSLRLLFEVVGVYWSERGVDASLFGVICSYVRDPRAFPGNSEFLLSQPSQNPSFLGRNIGRKIVFGKGRKRTQLGQNLRENTNFVKICPKYTPYSLIDKSLQRNLWRLWRQKVQTRCSVRACARVKREIESLFNSEWFRSLGEVCWRCCCLLLRV